MKICHLDESSYGIGYNDKSYYIPRALKGEMLERNLKPTFRSERKYVSVWDCFCRRELGPIVGFEDDGSRLY